MRYKTKEDDSLFVFKMFLFIFFTIIFTTNYKTNVSYIFEDMNNFSCYCIDRAYHEIKNPDSEYVFIANAGENVDIEEVLKNM